jgi:phosphomannomutase
MKTIVFDLDGTLTESKMSLQPDMAALICRLLKNNRVAVISGASWKQIEEQFLKNIGIQDQNLLNKLVVLPTSGASMYQIWGKYGWVSIYENKLSKKDINKISEEIEVAVKNSGVQIPEKIWGKQIENRECQVTWSALGQKAPSDEKSNWDPDFVKRTMIVSHLIKSLNGFEIKMGGLTSIDVTMDGISKKFGIDKLMQTLHISKDDVLFVGDSIFEGGNDYAAIEMGLDYHKVTSPSDTKAWIVNFLSESEEKARAS